MGYDLRIQKSFSLPPELPDPRFYRLPEYLVPLYRPWDAGAFPSSLGPEVTQNTMLSPLKLYMLGSLLEAVLPLSGDLFEAGSGSGGGARFMLDVLKRRGLRKRLWTLDTFSGYPEVDPRRDALQMSKGDVCCAGVESVRRLLETDGADVRVIPGRIPATLEQVDASVLCFAHIDVNLAEPTYEATRFCLERLAQGGILLFDDYNWPITYGARSAIEQACRESGQRPICLPESTQAFLIKS